MGKTQPGQKHGLYSKQGKQATVSHCGQKAQKGNGADTCERQEGEEQQQHCTLAVRHGRFRECDLRECYRLRQRQDVHKVH